MYVAKHILFLELRFLVSNIIKIAKSIANMAFIIGGIFVQFTTADERIKRSIHILFPICGFIFSFKIRSATLPMECGLGKTVSYPEVRVMSKEIASALEI